ncbi:MAG: DUF262 domain-containing protein [Firmicutes bacterium]|nr:DUF262 domain-containing protein [Bacillota bacterium]
MEFKGISDLFSNYYYAIPDYQRDYAWRNQENGVLLDDVFNLMEGHSKEHFIGAIVTTTYEEDNGTGKVIDFDDYQINTAKVKHVVDGQQRLTSLSILFCALDDLVKEETYSSTKDINMQKNLSGRLNAVLRSYSEIHLKTGAAAPRLILNENTGEYYTNSILEIDPEGETGDERYVGAKRIKAAYQFFESQIAKRKDDFCEDNPSLNELDFYNRLVSTLTDKVRLVEIQCTSSMDAFQVFDSLNGKGIDLTAADRIKNIFMHWSERGKGKQQWDSFISGVGDKHLTNFFVSLFFYDGGEGRISKAEIPNKFREYYYDGAHDDFSSFYKSLKADGETYGLLRKNVEQSKHPIQKRLEDLRRLSLDQVFVLIFAVCKRYPNDTVRILNKKNPNQNERKDFEEFLDTLTSLVIRMQVCDKSFNRLDTIFEKCIEKMKTGKAPLKTITRMIADEKKRLVSNNEFESAFIEFAPSNNTVSEYYLRKLETYMRKTNSGDNNPVPVGLSVEHIIPQDLPDLQSWYGKVSVPDEIKTDFKEIVVERIGNKALLFTPENSSASNNNYKEKLKVYKKGTQSGDKSIPESTFELIKDLTSNHPKKFNHTEVEKRAERLAKIAVKIWK